MCGINRVLSLCAVILVATTPFLICGCSHDRGLRVETTIPIKLYVQINQLQKGTEGGRSYFPQLKIFDPAGRLLYSDHVAEKNSEVMANLPESIRSLKPIPGAVTLTAFMESVPEFNAHQQEIAKQSKVTVVSIFLEDCHACTLQEHSLGDTEQKLLGRGMNVLTLHVARPENSLGK